MRRNHIERVWRLTRTLAAREVDRVGPGQLDVEVAELAALLHDIADWKYSGSETEGVERAREWLTEQGYCAAKKQRVLYIIENVSFHTELGKKEPGPEEAQPEASKLPTLELQIVQDADRLDAIGAIGVARAFTYGGHKKRPLYDLADGASIYRRNPSRPFFLFPIWMTSVVGVCTAPEQRATELMSKEEYMQKGKAGSQAKEDTVEHFYEKLLFLKVTAV